MCVVTSQLTVYIFMSSIIDILVKYCTVPCRILMGLLVYSIKIFVTILMGYFNTRILELNVSRVMSPLV